MGSGLEGVMVANSAGYARVSTREQAANSQALEQQIARLKAAGAAAVFTDIESGTKSDRPQLQALLNAIRSGKVSTLWVTRLDRLARHLPTLRQIIDTIQAHDVRLVALDEAIDLSTAAGKLQANLLGAFAESYSDSLSERISHGKAYARQKLRVSHAPLGYRKNHAAHLEPDRAPWFCTMDGQEWSRWDLARWFVEQYLALRAFGTVARSQLPIFGFKHFDNSSGVRRYLRSPVLRGHTTYYPKSPNPEIHYNTHAPLMTPSEWDQIQEIISLNRRVGKWASKGKYTLTGLVHCACGSRCVCAHDGTNTYHYWMCRNAEGCDRRKYTRQEKLEDWVCEQLSHRADQLSEIALSETTPPESPKLRSLREQLSGLRALGSNPAIAAAILDIQNQIAALTTNATEATAIDQDRADLLTAVFGRADTFRSLPTRDRRDLYLRLIERVTVDNGEPTGIEFKL